MPEFFNVLPPQQVLQVLLEPLGPTLLAASWEEVSTVGALGGITAEAVSAPEDLPSFPRVDDSEQAAPY